MTKPKPEALPEFIERVVVRRQHPVPPNTIVPKLAYSIAEGGAALGVSRPTLYAMIERGELRTVMVGRRRLIPATELERLLGEAS